MPTATVLVAIAKLFQKILPWGLHTPCSVCMLVTALVPALNAVNALSINAILVLFAFLHALESG